jgi:hypothetical protein
LFPICLNFFISVFGRLPFVGFHVTSH